MRQAVVADLLFREMDYCFLWSVVGVVTAIVLSSIVRLVQAPLFSLTAHRLSDYGNRVNPAPILWVIDSQ